MQRDQPAPRVIVLHSRDDVRLQEELLLHLRAATKNTVAVWSENDLVAGANIEHALIAAIDASNVALLLLSSSFLASWLESRRHLLDRLFERNKRGLALLPVVLRACPWKDHPFLGTLASFPLDGTPIAGLPKARRDGALSQISSSVRRLLRAREMTLVPQPRSAIFGDNSDISAEHNEPARAPHPVPANSVPNVQQAPPAAQFVRTSPLTPTDYNIVTPRRVKKRTGPPFCLTLDFGLFHRPLRLYFRRDITIGRLLDNDVTIDDTRVSRYHARILWNGFQWQIVDRGSRTGVRINGNFAAVQHAPLTAGTMVHLGDTTIRFESYELPQGPPDGEQLGDSSVYTSFESADVLPDERHLMAVIRNAAENARAGMTPALVLFGATITSDVMVARAEPDTLILHVAGFVQTLLPSGSFLARLRNDVLASVLWVGNLSELDQLKCSAKSLAPGALSVSVVSVPIFPRDKPYALVENAEGLLRETRITEY